MSRISLRQTNTLINILAIAIIILAVITAWIHLDRAIMMGFFGGQVPALHKPKGVGGGHAPGGSGGSLKSLIFSQLGLLFVLNAIGYIVLVIALYLPQLRRYQAIIRWVLIVFTAVTIIAYFALIGFGPNQMGYLDKIVEVALIVLLLIEGFQKNQLGRAR